MGSVLAYRLDKPGLTPRYQCPPPAQHSSRRGNRHPPERSAAPSPARPARRPRRRPHQDNPERAGGRRPRRPTRIVCDGEASAGAPCGRIVAARSSRRTVVSRVSGDAVAIARHDFDAHPANPYRCQQRWATSAALCDCECTGTAAALAGRRAVCRAGRQRHGAARSVSAAALAPMESTSGE